MFPHTVTVYNKYKEGTAEKWQRTVLRGVFWNAIKGATMRRTGVASADGLQLIIPFSVLAGRAYKPPKAWAALEDKDSCWTLQSGDVVVRGEIAREVVKSSSELMALDDVLTITSVDTKDFGGSLAHWEVSAR